ncbi:MAG: hypothetical protein NTX66_01605, partial [Candidatus Falkowbacteria bacterium]|nr:hypothetical protein [Candidatus Falkowbacteria bacterium]
KLGASKKIGIIENGSLTKNAKTKILATPILKINKKIYQIILQGLCRELSAWPPALAAAGLGELKALAKSDYDYQIGLLPLFFGQAQNLEIDSKIRPLIIKLGQANFYLWLAYKIYDNLLDNEGENILLPIANLAFKNFLTIYQNLSLGVKWDKFFSRLLVDLENYNYQELKNSQNYLKNSILMRPPRGATRHGAEFRNLHEKSLAHALGPLAILIYQGHRPNDKEFKKILNFFRGYLNARQLDDDLHDWPNDLGRGRINSVGYYILKSGQQKKFNLKTDLKILKKIFFKQALGPISQKLIKLINSAESALHGSNLIKQPEYLKQFLEPLKASVKKAESEHKELNLLLRDYKKLCS